MGIENTQTYQLKVVVILIKQQILVTNLQGNVLQVEESISNQILGVKGVKSMYSQTSIIQTCGDWAKIIKSLNN